jgi:putative SOS response-associated peptidase YedK
LPGIWEFARIKAEDILSACLIVGEPNPLVEGYHDRMPVMLRTEDYDRWLEQKTAVRDLRSLLKPYDSQLMEAYTVSRAANNVQNDTPECIAPMGEPPLEEPSSITSMSWLPR